MSSIENHEDRLKEFLSRNAVKRGSFILASGKLSDLYVDARLATMNPEGMIIIGNSALSAIRSRGWKPDAVGGLTMGADPVAFAISYTSALGKQQEPIRAFSVRKEPKPHGTGNRIEGPFRMNDAVVVVEDVITSGSSALRAIDAIEEAGGRILGVVAVVDRMEGGREAIQERGYDVVSLITKTELLK